MLVTVGKFWYFQTFYNFEVFFSKQKYFITGQCYINAKLWSVVCRQQAGFQCLKIHIEAVAKHSMSCAVGWCGWDYYPWSPDLMGCKHKGFFKTCGQDVVLPVPLLPVACAVHRRWTESVTRLSSSSLVSSPAWGNSHPEGNTVVQVKEM